MKTENARRQSMVSVFDAQCLGSALVLVSCLHPSDAGIVCTVLGSAIAAAGFVLTRRRA